jgi:hypothetical protein
VKFAVIPVEPGIFSIVPEKCRLGTENSETNQALAGQFPLQTKREFFGPNRELNPQNRELYRRTSGATAVHQSRTPNKPFTPSKFDKIKI